MNIQTYRFFEPGTIPGIPGRYSAGSVVRVDLDTMTVLPDPIEETQPVEETPTAPALHIEPASQEAVSIDDLSEGKGSL